MTTERADEPDNPDWDWRQTYSAQVDQTSTRFGFVDHLRVKRHDNSDGIGWDVLQWIKQDMLGTDVLAVEFYPPLDDTSLTTSIYDTCGLSQKRWTGISET